VLSLPQAIATTSTPLFAGETLTGNLALQNGANTVSLAAPAGLTSYTLTFPTTAGTAGQVLSTNGSGTTSWIANGVGGGSAYYASVYVGTNLTLPSNTTVTIPFNTKVLDSNTNFNAATYTYTAPLTGIYSFGVNLSMSAGGSLTRTLRLVKNGNPVTGASLTWGGENDFAAALVSLLSLTAGDLVTVTYSGRSGDSILAANTSININKI
jgi:hypothetical protein